MLKKWAFMKHHLKPLPPAVMRPNVIEIFGKKLKKLVYIKV